MGHDARVTSLVPTVPLLVRALFVFATLFEPAAASPGAADSGGPTQARPVADSDRIALPHARREFTSPSGRFVFVVSTPDAWKSLRAVGELLSITKSGRTVLWSRALPQQFGPRFVLVSDAGSVLMLDEWINVKTPYAVLLIDRDHRTVKQYGTDALIEAVRVPARDVVRQARHGWWISALPTQDAAGDGARVETAGKMLTIRFADGALAVE